MRYEESLSYEITMNDVPRKKARTLRIQLENTEIRAMAKV
jgi:hypothetical protein